MNNPYKALTEPAKQASLASMIAIGVALIALGVAFAAIAKTSRKAETELWP